VDETYVRIRGQWRYLYWAFDKHGEAVDFLLTANRDLDAVKRFFRKMLKDQPLLPQIASAGMMPVHNCPPSPRAESRDEGLLPRAPTRYVTEHLQQRTESDHFRVKRAMPWVGDFLSFHTARRTISGSEAMLWLRKGFGFAGAWTDREQNLLLARCFGLPASNKA
jgi:transposase-like protein